VGTLYRRAQARIEEVLIQEYAVPAEARSVSISIDRVASPMEESIEAPPVPVDPPWVAAVIAAAPPHPPEVQAVLDEQNQGDGPKVARNFRMAYAATVTVHDAEGESLHTIRYGRMPKGDVRGLCRGLARDVTAMRAQRPDLKIAYLTDGASEFETLYEQHLKMPLGPDAVSLVDFWHATEYLGAAARVFEIKRKAKPGQFRRWRHGLKHDERRRGADRRAAGAERAREGHARWRVAGRGRDPVLPGAPGAHGLRGCAASGPADRQRQRRGDVQEPGDGPHEAAGRPVEAHDRR
jgi:hypothetical protein